MSKKVKKKSNKKVKVKKDRRKKHDWADYKDGKKPKIVGIKQNVEEILTKDGQKYNRDIKNHMEHIIEQYALGKIKMQMPGSTVWITVQPSEEPGVPAPEKEAVAV